MKIIKQAVGIDVSKDSLECCFGSMDEQQNQSFSKSRPFPNDEKGFGLLHEWVALQSCGAEVWFVMEATGVYHENLSYWLMDRGASISVMLPSKVNHFAKTLELKTKTDRIDSRIICTVGLERKLSAWASPSPAMQQLRCLTREYRENKARLTAMKNQLHAKEHAYMSRDSTLARLKRQIALLEGQLLEIEGELRGLVVSDSQLLEKTDKLQTIPGVSFMTIICILGETNGFALVTSAKQLASYAGLDVMHNQSGNKEGRGRISKKGNSFIRNALYMPALCCTRFNPHLKEFYVNLIDRKPAKKIGVTAVARKLLILIYTLWKNNSVYQPDYPLKNVQ